MYIKVNNAEAFVSTGGKEAGGKIAPADFTATQGNAPALLFIHGSGQSHLSWILQARFFANRGYKVLAPDLPGHGLSAGDAPENIADAADWCAALLDAAGVAKAIAIGHSQGGLVALELARRHGVNVSGLAIIASAAAIAVADGLLAMAESDETAASRAMVDWGHGGRGRHHDHTMPGQSHLLFGRRVMAGNDTGALHTDLMACRNYKDGMEAAAAIACPALCVLAGNDRMVPVKFGLELARALPDCRHIVIDGAGHFVQSEYPDETNTALREFFESVKDDE